MGATAPTSPSAGDQWLDTSAATAVLKVYKDSSSTWVNATTIPIATTSVYGTVRLATAADVTNGTSGKIVDAAQLQSKVSEVLSNDVNLNGNLNVNGNLTVDGTTTTIDTTTLVVEDKNIEMGSVDTPTDTTADGGGITLKGTTDKTINWVNATDAWTSSERFDLPAGTAAAPSLIFNGDVNSGLYSPGADQVAISTNGTGRLFIDANGNVGVGSGVSALGANYGTLSIRGKTNDFGGGIIFESLDGTDRTFAYGNVGAFYLITQDTRPLIFGTNAIEKLRITSDGKLGLGTSSPTDKLTVQDGSVRVVGPTNTWANLTVAANSAATGGVNRSAINLYDAAGTGGCILRGAHDAGLFDLRTLVAGVETPRITVQYTTGNVGIGTTSPSSLLHLEKDAALGISLERTGAVPSSCSMSNAGNVLALSHNVSGIQFNTGSTPTERARIDSAGKLLVGTSTALTTRLITTTLTPSFQVKEGGGGSALFFCGINGATPATIFAAKSRGTSYGTIVQNNDGLLRISAAGDDGVQATEAARIDVAVDGTPGANDMPGRLMFSTTPSGSATPVERLRITSAGVLQIADAGDIAVGTTTGTKIGTATSQKIGFYNTTPVVQPTTGVAEAAFVENSGGTAVNVDSTFGGYTIQQVVQALQNLGLFA